MILSLWTWETSLPNNAHKDCPKSDEQTQCTNPVDGMHKEEAGDQNGYALTDCHNDGKRHCTKLRDGGKYKYLS